MDNNYFVIFNLNKHDFWFLFSFRKLCKSAKNISEYSTTSLTNNLNYFISLKNNVSDFFSNVDITKFKYIKKLHVYYKNNNYCKKLIENLDNFKYLKCLILCDKIGFITEEHIKYLNPNIIKLDCTKIRNISHFNAYKILLITDANILCNNLYELQNIYFYEPIKNYKYVYPFNITIKDHMDNHDVKHMFLHKIIMNNKIDYEGIKHMNVYSIYLSNSKYSNGGSNIKSNKLIVKKMDIIKLYYIGNIENKYLENKNFKKLGLSFNKKITKKLFENKIIYKLSLEYCPNIKKEDINPHNIHTFIYI